MDALEFINERDRMCAASECCHTCFANRNGCIFNYPANNTAKEQVKVLEKWSKENPRKTRQSLLLEHYPYARSLDGVIMICPKALDTSFSCPLDDNIDCAACKHEFWNQEVE